MMPKRSNEFQRLIYLIQHELSDEAKVTESKMIENKQTGSPVEVDIVVETESGGLPIVISVECTTSSSRSATVEWVREMRGKHQDLSTNKLVLVSGTGFSQEAERLARAHGIEAITFKEAELFDWAGALSELLSKGGLQISRFDMQAKSWTLKFDPVEKGRLDELAHLHFDDQSRIYSPNGELQGTIQQIGTLMLGDRSIGERVMRRWAKDRKTNFQITWNVPPGTQVVDPNGNNFRLKAFIIDGYTEVESTPVHLSPAIYGKTQVAHGKVPDIFSGRNGEATIFFAEREGNDPKGGLAFSSDSGFGKTIFPMQKPSTSFDEVD
jgi:hypothetical protein